MTNTASSTGNAASGAAGTATTTAPPVGRVSNTNDQPDLTGNLKPVADEADISCCETTGELPAGLRGSFIRNGPNPVFEPLGRYHMFDGDGMLHGITFGDEGVSYRNRWIRSSGLDRELELGHAIYPGLGDIMNMPGPELTGDAGPIKNPANTHVIQHANRYLALWEGGAPTEFTPDLATVGEYDFDGRLVGAMTAHPRIDQRTGEMFFFGYSLFAPYLRYHVVEADGTLVHSTDIDLPVPVMMHDFVITEEHAVFLDSPMAFNMESLGTGPMVSWKPELGTRIGVMPRRGNGEDITWYEIANGHVQHFWNGWVEGRRIEFSGSRFSNPNFGIDGSAELDERTAGDEAGRPARYWVDLDAGTAGWEPIDDLEGDFNRVNDTMVGQRTNIGYMSAFVSTDRHIGDFDTIVKYDTTTNSRTEWFAGRHGHVGESVFAPDPAGQAEDDGWLINAVHDDETGETDLVVIDARDVAAGPIATVSIPRRMPFGFHANWFPAD